MRVRWTHNALDQLTEIADSLLGRSPDAAERIVQRILERISTLARLPWSGPPWKATADPSLRRLVIGEHVVIYRVDEADEAIFILAVRIDDSSRPIQASYRLAEQRLGSMQTARA